MKYANNMLELIGNTPLLKLNKVAKGLKANVFVKLEHLNPSGSYKDRMALAMIEAAERGDTWNNKKLLPGGTVLEASAGNTAPAVALVCAVKDYNAKIMLYRYYFEKGTDARMNITMAYGPEVGISSNPEKYCSKEELRKFREEGIDLAEVIAGKVDCAVEEKNNKNSVFLDQIYNSANYIGQKSIGYEIYDQLDGKIDAIGCSVGSGASLYGMSLALAEKGLRPESIFGVVPEGSEQYMKLLKDVSNRDEFEVADIMKKIAKSMGLEKWSTEKPIVEKLIENGYPDTFYRISAEEAREMANKLCEEEGIYCGMSSGANVAVALKIAENMKEGQNIVTLIVDRRDRYLSEYPNDIYAV